MDYSEIIKESQKSDLEYAKWYATLPDERKAEMIISGYNFVANNIKEKVKSKNPFATQADILLKFIELTQKEDYPEDTFAFIKSKLQERSEKEWQQRFKTMKKQLGWSYEDMAKYMGGASGASIKASVNRKLPGFAKLLVCVFEQCRK